VVDVADACGAGVCDRETNAIIPEVCSVKFRVCDAGVSSLKFYKMKLFRNFLTIYKKTLQVPKILLNSSSVRSISGTFFPFT
jgi:hypothetical protein